MAQNACGGDGLVGMVVLGEVESRQRPPPICPYRHFIDAEDTLIGKEHLAEARAMGGTRRLLVKQLQPKTYHGAHLCGYFLWVYQAYLTKLGIDVDAHVLPFFVGYNNAVMGRRAKRLCIHNARRARLLHEAENWTSP